MLDPEYNFNAFINNTAVPLPNRFGVSGSVFSENVYDYSFGTYLEVFAIDGSGSTIGYIEE
jgi:hypothetical protein